MKLGEVLKKERSGTGLSRVDSLSAEEVAEKLGLSVGEYEEMESGESPLEHWFPLLCRLAVKLKKPTSRLLAKSGKSEGCNAGQAGPLIRGHREERGRTIEEMSAELEIDVKEYVLIEKGDSPIEKYGPLMLRFAEIIDQPVFNLFHPCGVPYDKLDDYP